MQKIMVSLCTILFLCVVELPAQHTINKYNKVSTVPSAVKFSASSQNPAEANNSSLQKVASLTFPSMTYPINGSTNIPLVPKFLITTVIGGLRYDLQVATDQYFNDVIQSSSWIFSSSTDSVFSLRYDPAVINPNDIKNNTTYYWRVKVTDSSGTNTSGWSQPYSYTTMSTGTSVDQPKLSMPVMYDIVQWVGTTFYWLPSSGATQYQIQWSTDLLFDSFNYLWSDGNATSLIENLKPNTTYYWRIVAYNDDALSRFSSIGIFYTGKIDTLTATSSSFDDGSGTDNYANGLDVKWLIAPPTAKQINLSFSSFNTEANYDFVTVYDGTTTDAPVLGKFSGDSLPPRLQSSGGTMLVRFTTDSYTNASGWNANYYSITANNAISGKLLNLTFDPWTGDSSMTPLSFGATVKLYQGSFLVDSVVPGSDGRFILSGLDSNQFYKVIVNSKGTDPISQQSINLSYQDTATAGRNNVTFIIPLSLFETKYSLIDSLEQPQIDVSSVTDLNVGSVNLHGYNDSTASNLLNSWSNLSVPFTNSNASSLIRLTMTESYTNRFLQDAGSLSIATLQTLLPLIQRCIGVFTMGDIASKSTDELIMDIGKTIGSSALEAAQDKANSEISKIPQPTGQLLQRVSDGLFSTLSATLASTEDPSDFLSEQYINNWVIPSGIKLILENCYIPPTEKFLNQIIVNSGNLSESASESFSLSNAAYITSHNNTINTINTSNSLLKASDYLNDASSILEAAGALSALTGFGAPAGAIMVGISSTISIGSAGTSGIALANDFWQLVNLQSDFESTMNSVYHPIFNTNLQIRNAKNSNCKLKSFNKTVSKMVIASSDYNAALQNLLTQVKSKNRSAARSAIFSILALDSVLNYQTKSSRYIMYAGYPIADTSILNFDTLYSYTNDNIASSFSIRQATYLNIIAYFLDSTKTSYADSLNLYGQAAINANNNMNLSVNQVLNTLQQVSIPGYIGPTFIQKPSSIIGGSKFIIKVNFQNYGGATVNNLYAKLILTSGYSTSNDSIQIGDLAPDAYDSISFLVVAPNVDTIGSFSVLFLSDNASSYPATGSLHSTKVTSVGNYSLAIPKNFALSQNYPNPFNPTTVISYQLPTISNVSLKVYDILGREVATLINERQTDGTHQVTFNASKLASGVYFYRLTTGSFTQVKKMVLVK